MLALFSVHGQDVQRSSLPACAAVCDVRAQLFSRVGVSLEHFDEPLPPFAHVRAVEPILGTRRYQQWRRLLRFIHDAPRSLSRRMAGGVASDQVVSWQPLNLDRF